MQLIWIFTLEKCHFCDSGELASRRLFQSVAFVSKFYGSSHLASEISTVITVKAD